MLLHVIAGAAESADHFLVRNCRYPFSVSHLTEGLGIDAQAVHPHQVRHGFPIRALHGDMIIGHLRPPLGHRVTTLCQDSGALPNSALTLRCRSLKGQQTGSAVG